MALDDILAILKEFLGTIQLEFEQTLKNLNMVYLEVFQCGFV